MWQPNLLKNTRSPNHLMITLGSMNDAHGLEVQVVIFNRDKPLWDQLDTDVPLFDVQALSEETDLTLAGPLLSID